MVCISKRYSLVCIIIFMDVKILSSKKKKKNTAPNKNAASDAKPGAVKKADTAPKTEPSPAKSADNEQNIPVQSLSEMLAFAHEAEAKMESEEAAAEKNTVSSEESKEAERQPEPQKPAAEPKAVPQQKPAEVKKQETKPAPAKTAVSGPPVTEAEQARREAALDALDRDLEAARSKKLREEAYLKRQRDEELKKEAERLERAQKAQQRHENAAEMAKKREEAAKAAAAEQENPADILRNASDPQSESPVKKPAPKPEISKKRAVDRYFNRALFSMAAGRAVAAVAIVVLIAYGGAHIYVNSLNEKIYEGLDDRLSGQSRLVSDASIPYEVPEFAPLSANIKQQDGLSIGLADSDKDGLTDDYEIDISLTDPLNPDSDEDGVTDGAEVHAGLDPLNPSSNGTDSDGELSRDLVLTGMGVSANITGISKTAHATLSYLENNSIQGTPGLAGSAYEFYTDKNFEGCTLTFSYAQAMAQGEIATEAALSVYRFDPQQLSFAKVDSTLDTSAKTVAANITDNGIYALCDSSILMQKGTTNIFFLIDNSGSMYPEELCANSEENDVEFKRLDFAVNLIDMLGQGANYGAGEFSGKYTNITPLSNDYQAVKQKISDIRNKHQVFSGTEIAGAVTAAVKEFGQIKSGDKNYIILLTDGMPSVYNDARERAAIEAAKKNGITVFTIGLGKYIDSDYLSGISDETNGQFFQASNADALDNIYEKIKNFMSYNQVTIEEDSGRKGYIIADSGFNVQRDGIGYSNFRSDFAPNGADVGIAGLIRAYYTGELPLKTNGYGTIDGKSIPGYDISGMEGFKDGKADLTNVEISALSSYNTYSNLKNKWDHKSIKDGLLSYSKETRKYIDSTQLKIFPASYEFTVPEENGFVNFLRAITFNKVKEFNKYECVLLDSATCTGDDAAVMDMLRWYCEYPNSGKCTVLDFGYQGDLAFAALTQELTTGSPAVITYGGSAMNAVRLARDVNDPDKFVLDAYDSNSPDRSTHINIQRTPIYDNGTVTYQYAASRGTEEQPLRIFISNEKVNNTAASQQ